MDGNFGGGPVEKGISNGFIFTSKCVATNPKQTEIVIESAPGLTVLLSPKQGLTVFFSCVLSVCRSRGVSQRS